MVSLKEIQDYANCIAREFNPQKIILFGSYANGHPKEDSDVDLLVVLSNKVKDPSAKAVEIRIKIGTRFPMDIIVKDSAQLSKRIQLGDSFLKDIVQNGKFLYEASDKRMD